MLVEVDKDVTFLHSWFYIYSQPFLHFNSSIAQIVGSIKALISTSFVLKATNGEA